MMRGDFATDPALGPALFALLDEVFPGLAAGAERLRGWGAAWEEVSTPFVAREDGALVAHAGLIRLPLVLEGRATEVGTVHAVATRPDRRGRGHGLAVLRELLDWAEGRLDSLVLTTEIPDFYRPLGFRVVQEHGFHLPMPAGAGSRQARRLDLGKAQERALLLPLLRERDPVSHVLGVRPESPVFLFNEGRQGVWWSDELGCAWVAEARPDGAVRLFDVVARHLPRLAELAPWLPAAPRLELAFAPDRLAPEAEPRPWLFEHDGPSWLMVRGKWLSTGAPHSLPRSART